MCLVLILFLFFILLLYLIVELFDLFFNEGRMELDFYIEYIEDENSNFII